MADSILTLDGVRVDSAPVFMPDCSFPVTDWANCCYRDDFVNNFPIHVGHWSKNTKAPAIIGKKFKVKTPAASTDDCELSIATVSTEMETQRKMCIFKRKPARTTKKINSRFRFG